MICIGKHLAENGYLILLPCLFKGRNSIANEQPMAAALVLWTNVKDRHRRFMAMMLLCN